MGAKTHGQTSGPRNARIFTKVYIAWRSMKQRCDNPNVKNYDKYGGRGITYQENWKTFEVFLRDMGEPPDDYYQLDRRDNEKNYTKDNCRWATPKQQSNNKGSYRNNTSGVKGVSWHTRYKKWTANAQWQGKQIQLYSGLDFFEACCARKSWENRVIEPIVKG